MNTCKDCKWWTEKYSGTGFCAGNRLHVFHNMGEVNIEGGKRGQSVMHLTTSANFGCVAFESKNMESNHNTSPKNS